MDEKHIKMIEQTYYAVVGNSEYKQKGIIDELKEEKERVDRIQRKQNNQDVQIRAVIGVFVILAFIVALLSDWFKMFP